MTTPQADQAAPHASRSAPLCSNCKHNAGEFCNHPAAPINVVTGKPTAQCQLSRYLSQDGGGPNCGMNGRLFEAKPSPAFHLNWGGWPVPEEKAAPTDTNTWSSQWLAGQQTQPAKVFSQVDLAAPGGSGVFVEKERAVFQGTADGPGRHATFSQPAQADQSQGLPQGQVLSVSCLPGAVLLLLDAVGQVVFRKDLAGIGHGWVPCVEFTRAVLMGPQGCGKTTHADAIRDALGLTSIVDDWVFGDPLPDGALGITNDGAARVEAIRIESTPHISRLAPRCEDCVHFVPHSRVRRRRCNHPAVPIIPLEGAQDEAFIGLNDCFSLRGDRGLCGSAGSLFSAKPGPDLSSEV